MTFPEGRQARPRGRHWDDEPRFRELWADQTITLGDIATVFGIASSTVSFHARENLGLPPRKKGTKHQPDQTAPDELAGGRWVTVAGVNRWIPDA